MIKEINPYGDTLPYIARTRNDLSRPDGIKEELFCWFYWIEMITNPKTTRKALNMMDSAPEFKATWGSDWDRGEKLMQKHHPKLK